MLHLNMLLEEQLLALLVQSRQFTWFTSTKVRILTQVRGQMSEAKHILNLNPKSLNPKP